MLTAIAPVMGAQKPATAPAAVVFSHMAMPLDSATFVAMLNSPFLRAEFGGFEERPSAPGSTNASFLYYGRDSYLEFLSPRPTFPPGSEQLAFIVERSGDLHRAVDALLARRPRVIAYSLNFRRLGADSVPIFYRARIRPAVQPLPQPRSAELPVIYADILERHQGFLRRADPTIPRDSIGVTNVEYLSRRWKPGAYLGSVIGVTVAADSADVAALAGDLSALGYEVRQAVDTVIATRAGFSLSLLSATAARRGILALRLATQRPKEGQKIYRFGPRSILRFEQGNIAHWTF